MPRSSAWGRSQSRHRTTLRIANLPRRRPAASRRIHRDLRPTDEFGRFHIAHGQSTIRCLSATNQGHADESPPHHGDSTTSAVLRCRRPVSRNQPTTIDQVQTDSHKEYGRRWSQTKTILDNDADVHTIWATGPVESLESWVMSTAPTVVATEVPSSVRYISSVSNNVFVAMPPASSLRHEIENSDTSPTRNPSPYTTRL